MNFDEKIIKIRKDNNLTQEEMAEKLNVSRQAISNWENKRNLPDIEMLIIISKIFSISRLASRSFTFCVMPVGIPPHFLNLFQISTEYTAVCFSRKSK